MHIYYIYEATHVHIYIHTRVYEHHTHTHNTRSLKYVSPFIVLDRAIVYRSFFFFFFQSIILTAVGAVVYRVYIHVRIHLRAYTHRGRTHTYATRRANTCHS